ncbi:MAG: hypothetical protein AB7P76_01225 [Candidatus Melainabacteria bacterium]
MRVLSGSALALTGALGLAGCTATAGAQAASTPSAGTAYSQQSGTAATCPESFADGVAKIVRQPASQTTINPFSVNADFLGNPRFLFMNSPAGQYAIFSRAVPGGEHSVTGTIYFDCDKPLTDKIFRETPAEPIQFESNGLPAPSYFRTQMVFELGLLLEDTEKKMLTGQATITSPYGIIYQNDIASEFADLVR